MKVTTLIENTTADPSLHCEHGLSLYIETGEHKILFDMGQSAAFADNAQALGVDLGAVDLAVLSHGHYDHGGGLSRFLEINPTAPVYLSQHAFEPHYNGTDKYIGLDAGLDPCLASSQEVDSERFDRWIFTAMDVGVDRGIWLYVAEGREGTYPLDPAGLRMAAGNPVRELVEVEVTKAPVCHSLESGFLIPEDFRHEQYLMIHENGKRILFSGCSHRGILNIMEWFRPDILIGGFHFSKIDPEGEGRAHLDQAAEILSQYDCTYYTCHCTGLRQYDYLKEKMGERLHYLSTGQTLEV